MPGDTAYVALGSNVGNPILQIEQAIEEISVFPSIQLKRASHLYQSKAIGPKQPDIINAVIQIETILSPIALLDILQQIESRHHRKRVIKWGPRTLDCDIILFGQKIIQSERLKIPHPEMTNRNFVICPLYEIAKDLILPDNSPLENHIKKFDQTQIQKIKFAGA